MDRNMDSFEILIVIKQLILILLFCLNIINYSS